MNRQIKNTTWLLIGNLFRMIFQFVMNIIIARYLGPKNQGTINYVAAYTAFFTSIVSFGINGVIIHELINHQDNGAIIGTAFFLRLIAGTISMFAMVGIVWATDNGQADVLVITVLQALQLPFCAMDTIKYWYQRNLQSSKSVIVTSTGYALSCIYKVYILFAHKGIIWFGFASSLDIILIGILYLLTYNVNGEAPLRWSWVVAERMLRACAPFAVANIMIYVYSKIDTIMIRHMMHSMTQVGYYTTAVIICGYISFVPSAILDSARPVIMEAKRTDKNTYAKRMKQAIFAVMSVGVIYAIIIAVFGKSIIRILYGEAYLGALGSLRIAVWYTSFSFLGSAKSIWLICEGKNRYVLLFASAGAVSNVVLNALMIPSGGIEGAAVATLLTQFLTHMVFPAFLSETRGFAKWTLEALVLKNVR